MHVSDSQPTAMDELVQLRSPCVVLHSANTSAFLGARSQVWTYVRAAANGATYHSRTSLSDAE